MIQQRIDETGTLVVEWDNKGLPKSKSLAVILPLFWIAWVAMIIIVTYKVSMNEPGALEIIMGVIALAVACGIAAAIPVTWLIRNSREQVKISSTVYRHFFPRYPRLFPKKWRIADISAVEFGHYVAYNGRESIVTLSVWKGTKRDILAYWISDDLKQDIFEIITHHLRENGCEFKMVDNFSKGN